MSEGAGFGQLRPEDSASEFNRQKFFFDQMMGQIWTGAPAVVTSVSGGGKGSQPVVSVQVMVNQIDGEGFATPHGQVHSIPCIRWRGGKNAIICDAEVGDRGFLMVASRDMSSVKQSGGVANPGSERRFSLSDSVFVGCFSASEEPEQFVQFKSDGGIRTEDKFGNVVDTSEDGIKLTDKSGNEIDMKAGSMKITPANGTLLVQGAIAATGGISANDGLHTVAGHVHSGVQSGSSNTGPPVNE